MAANVFTGTAVWSSAGDWTDGVPTSDDTVDIQGDCTMDQDGVCATLDIDGGDELDMATYSMPVGVTSGAVVVDGNLKMGSTSGVGLTCGILTITAGTRELLSDSNINVYGDLVFSSGDITTGVNPQGNLTILSSINYDNESSSNYWSGVTVTSDITVTDSSGNRMRFTSEESHTCIITGTVANNAVQLDLGCNATGTMTFSSTANISGTGTILWKMVNGATYTHSRTDAMAYAGIMSVRCKVDVDIAMPTGRWDNAQIEIADDQTGTMALYGSPGLLTMENFDFDLGSGDDLDWYNNISNQSFKIIGAIDTNWNQDVSAPNSYTKGTGSWTFAYTGSIDWFNFSDWSSCDPLENFIIDCGANTIDANTSFKTNGLVMTSGTLSLDDGVITTVTTGVSGTGGTLNSRVPATQAIVAVTAPANWNWTGGTITDIAINGTNGDHFLSCKGCTNGGNNDQRVIFNDSFGGFGAFGGMS